MNSLPIWLLHVRRTERITPRLARVTLTGDDLRGFSLTEPDQQVKLYFPRPGQSRPLLPEADGAADLASWYQALSAVPEDERPWMRSYTIRAHDPATHSLTFDFVLHRHAGPATRWAMDPKEGDCLGVFGPSSYFARPEPLSASLAEADWVLLAGDDTAVPGMATIVESLPAGKRVLAFVEVQEAADEQPFRTEADLTTTWLHRGAAEPGRSETLADALRAAVLPGGEGFAWIAGEAGLVRRMRRHLLDDRGMARSRIEFSGCWRLTLAQDDAPTAEDLAEAQERLAEARARFS
ncbi:siderophore-interacting protein [Streptomyces sp. CC208A]|uniref:siderophore-interacting protein n=1 Tax=Streptomyces sp. CC208A TaxID=3044573 RepID=UPI0024A8B940|nr:siderophore-interacting protein [Streptomyces sp. CC208A]